MGIFLISCSSDDGDADSSTHIASVALPENVLGLYDGIFTGISTNVSETATIVRSGDKRYTINFDAGTPSITDVEFIKTVVGNAFTISPRQFETRELSVAITFNEEDAIDLGIVQQEGGIEKFSFIGQKK